MTERNDEIIEVTGQIRRHLESLRAAGVEWLPASVLPRQREENAGTSLDKGTRGQGDKGTRGTDGTFVGAIGAEPETNVISPPPLVPSSPCPLVPLSNDIPLSVSAPESAAAPEQRRRELAVLAERVSGCMRCKELASTRTQTVFGVGPINADLCFVGEAPGRDEDAAGEPFVGAAGQLLTRIIVGMGLKRDDVYICNILRCRPPNNRPPQPDEAANCREYLEQTLELVRPKVICALGASAAKYLLRTSQGISRLRGKWQAYRDVPVMCTYHPSYLLRVPDGEKLAKKREVWEDMKLVLARLGKQIPLK